MSNITRYVESFMEVLWKFLEISDIDLEKYNLMTHFFFQFDLAVRFGRVPKREKARIEAAMQQSTRNRALTTNVWTDLEDLQHVIDTVVGAHLETCEFTRDRVREMKLRAKDSPNYTEPTRVS